MNPGSAAAGPWLAVGAAGIAFAAGLIAARIAFVHYRWERRRRRRSPRRRPG